MPDKEDLYDAAIDLYADDKFDEAIELYARALDPHAILNPGVLIDPER